MSHAFSDLRPSGVRHRSRQPLLGPDTRPRLHAWMAGTARTVACVPHQAGGRADRVHILFRLHRTQSISDLVHGLKSL